jgi:EmrB/QacA subfamily drug resistance transporter
MAAVGPVLGGFLIEHGSWRWVFFINVPVAMIVLALAFWRVPESRNPDAARAVDWIGAILVTAGLASVVYALIESPQRGWNDAIVAATFVFGVLALAAFVVIEATSTNPLLPLSLFSSRDFTGTNLLTLLLYSAVTGLLFFLPLNLIQVQGYSPTAAGASMLPFILLMFLLSRWSGGLVDRYGAKRPLILGPVLVAAGFLLFTIPGTDGSYWTTYFPAVVVLGLGMAITVAPLTTTVMNSVPAERAGTASGINNAVSRLAGVLSIAALGIVMLTTFDRQLFTRMAALELPTQTQQQIESERAKLAAIEIPPELDSRLREEIRRSVDESFVAGFRVVMFVAACLAVLSSMAAKLFIEDKPKG